VIIASDDDDEREGEASSNGKKEIRCAQRLASQREIELIVGKFTTPSVPQSKDRKLEYLDALD
jgi:hypothetical protein